MGFFFGTPPGPIARSVFCGAITFQVYSQQKTNKDKVLKERKVLLEIGLDGNGVGGTKSARDC